MRVAIIIVVAIALVAGVVVTSTGAARGHAKPGQLTYRVYFPTISVPRDAGISLVRIVVTCGHVAAVTRIPTIGTCGHYYLLTNQGLNGPIFNTLRTPWSSGRVTGLRAFGISNRSTGPSSLSSRKRVVLTLSQILRTT